MYQETGILAHTKCRLLIHLICLPQKRQVQHKQYNNFAHNWEVKDGEHRTVHIKIASIDTVDFVDIAMYMAEDYPWSDPK